MQVFHMKVVATGYMDANGYKRGKGQVTSQIESRCQCGQRGQKSCTTSTLTLRNGEAVTHHFSYHREGEKQMGSASASYQTEKTQKIEVQALVMAGRRGAVHQTYAKAEVR